MLFPREKQKRTKSISTASLIRNANKDLGPCPTYMHGERLPDRKLSYQINARPRIQRTVIIRVKVDFGFQKAEVD